MTTLMGMPYVKLVGGLLLIWIAVRLLGGEEDASEDNVKSSSNLWHAIRVIAVADTVMSPDNVIAIAIAARGDFGLLMIGLAISIPLIMVGATIVMALLDRFPIIVWAGGALLGWIAGEIIAKDPLIANAFDPSMSHILALSGAALGAMFLVGVALFLRLRQRDSCPSAVPEAPNDPRDAPDEA